MNDRRWWSSSFHGRSGVANIVCRCYRVPAAVVWHPQVPGWAEGAQQVALLSGSQHTLSSVVAQHGGGRVSVTGCDSGLVFMSGLLFLVCDGLAEWRQAGLTAVMSADATDWLAPAFQSSISSRLCA
jgi:hypothetical protein